MAIKKLLCIMLALLFLTAGLTGCTNGGQDNTSESGTTTETAETTAITETTEQRDPFVRVPLNFTQQGTEYFSPVLGLCEDYPRGTMAYSIDRDFGLMAKYGIRDMRVSIAWGDYEPSKGNFRWELLDEKVRYAEKHGIELYPYICYSPTWATGTSDWRSPPQDLQDWYDFVYTVVERYKGRITYWELWNEGDNRDFWTGTWVEQLRLVKRGAEAVKAANPDAVTIFGGLTNLSPSHVDTIFTSGVADYIDVINIHFYNETWNRAPTEQIFESTRFVADVIRRNGARQELWIAEIGYSDYVEESGRVSGWYSINYPYEKTREFQAVTFFRALSRIYATEDVSTVLWYEIKNLRLDSVAIGDVNNYHLGALDHDYFPKHLWFAIAAAKSLFADPFKAIDQELAVETGDGSVHPIVHAFQRQNGDVVLLAWNRGANSRSINVSLPGTFSSALRYSVTGEKEEYDYITENETTSLDLTLQPEYMHIIELFAADMPARLTLENPVVTSISDMGYEVEVTAANIGKSDAENIYAEIVINKDLKTDQAQEILIPRLSAGEKMTISWQVEIADPQGQPQLWLAVRHADSAPAAILVELP